MDAKSKAEFINSVAENKTIICKNCGAKNEPGSMFCFSCGTKLNQEESKSEPAFNQADTAKTDDAPQSAVADNYNEPDAVFADGLPDWDIIPPQVVVRRR